MGVKFKINEKIWDIGLGCSVLYRCYTTREALNQSTSIWQVPSLSDETNKQLRKDQEAIGWQLVGRLARYWQYLCNMQHLNINLCDPTTGMHVLKCVGHADGAPISSIISLHQLCMFFSIISCLGDVEDVWLTSATSTHYSQDFLNKYFDKDFYYALMLLPPIASFRYHCYALFQMDAWLKTLWKWTLLSHPDEWMLRYKLGKCTINFNLIKLINFCTTYWKNKSATPWVTTGQQIAPYVNTFVNYLLVALSTVTIYPECCSYQVQGWLAC